MSTRHFIFNGKTDGNDTGLLTILLCQVECTLGCQSVLGNDIAQLFHCMCILGDSMPWGHNFFQWSLWEKKKELKKSTNAT